MLNPLTIAAVAFLVAGLLTGNLALMFVGLVLTLVFAVVALFSVRRIF